MEPSRAAARSQGRALLADLRLRSHRSVADQPEPLRVWKDVEALGDNRTGVLLAGPVRSCCMSSVNSVLGPLDVADLGFTLTHEHLFTASAGIQQTFPELFGDFQVLTNEVVSALSEARDGGVRTIIEVSTMD